MTNPLSADGTALGIAEANVLPAASAPQPAGTPSALATEPDAGGLGVWSLGFQSVVWTQFLGALNDNMFRWLVVSVAAATWERELVLAVGGAVFMLPFMLLAAPAGFLADRYRKRDMMIAMKWAEIAVMILGTIALGSGNNYAMMAAVFLMAAQSTLFGPAKLGGIPEMLRREELPKASGIANLATMVACILGTVLGYGLYDLTYVKGTGFVGVNLAGVMLPGLAVCGGALIVVAALGTAVSYGIAARPAANPGRRLDVNLFGETAADLRMLFADAGLGRVALGAAYFWALGALAQSTINTYAEKSLQVESAVAIGLLLVALAVGVSLGSVLAGFVCRRRPEVGMVPLAALALSISALMLLTTSRSYNATALWLFLMGFFGGFYDVPLISYLQRYSDENKRGSIFAALNFITFAGMLVVSGLFFPLSKAFTPPQIFALAGIATLGVGIYMFWTVQGPTLRFLAWLLSLLVYRVRVYGAEHVPEKGGALLVCNHVSWLDGILVGMFTPREVRFIAFDENLNHWFVRYLCRVYRVIPINSRNGPKALLRSLMEANEGLRNGDLICIFAEGAITRTGQTLAFQRGMMKILEGTNAPVIPLYINELWGSLFSFRGGKFFKKRPRSWPYPVTLQYGEPIVNPRSPFEIRQKVLECGERAMQQRKNRVMTLPRQFLRNCRRAGGAKKICDSTGQALTGTELLLKTLAVRSLLSRLIGRDEAMVGVLLPPSVGGAVVNAALPLLRRVAVNLNYTLKAGDLEHQIQDCGIKHVITSRKFQEKINIPLSVPYLYLEDFAGQITFFDKLQAALLGYLAPANLIDGLFGLHSVQHDDLLTIIFTSGSTGEAKGVMLTHHNVATNVEAIDHLFTLKPTDCLLGVLPFFHSFGFTGTLWSVLTLRAKGVYHFNPLDARTVGKLVEEERVTILMSTPTFLRSYIKRIDKAQFASLDLVITGAEKLPKDLAEAFHEKYGIRINEGYGTTELSPLVSVNVPDHRAPDCIQEGSRFGTVGRPIPGVLARVVDPDTGVELPVGEPGMLQIKGPNVMRGYLNKPQKTAEVIRDGWYTTGDVAKIDEDGFITITDRLSRFSKIGGEMVPHLKIEELLTQILALPTDEGPELRAVVTAVPDSRKGERLIVVHKPLHKTPEQIASALSERGLPNLWIPSNDSYLEVSEFPVLGTGKLDLKGLKALAAAKFRENGDAAEETAGGPRAKAAVGP